MNADDSHFTPADDLEALQAAFLAAAIEGDETCRGQLASLYSGFEEPYRTIAATLLEQTLGGGFADQHTVCAALDGCRLRRRGPDGIKELTAREAVNLVCSNPVDATQAAAYLPILRKSLEAKRRNELKERTEGLFREFGDDPVRLGLELKLIAAASQRGHHPTEAMQFIPYFTELTELQQGTEFQGLDTGFPLLNQTTNGLDTGLWVVAAAPSAGKTTFAFQLCQQVAEKVKVPVIFVSLEQSARELRAKALARFSKIDSRHIGRGRLRSDNADDMAKLQEAGRRYFNLSHYLTIVEGDDTTTIDSIAGIAAAQMTKKGVARCFIVVDYLQILPLQRDDAGRVTSTKDRIDLHISALRRLARQLDSPLLAISSENRDGYDKKGMSVFKESGGIEYGADIAVVMSLDKDATSGAGGQCRVVDFNVIKNRNGALGVVKFKFYPERAEFVETGKGQLPVDEDE